MKFIIRLCVAKAVPGEFRPSCEQALLERQTGTSKTEVSHGGASSSASAVRNQPRYRATYASLPSLPRWMFTRDRLATASCRPCARRAVLSGFAKVVGADLGWLIETDVLLL
jgi:hypothetical protein